MLSWWLAECCAVIAATSVDQRQTGTDQWQHFSVESRKSKCTTSLQDRQETILKTPVTLQQNPIYWLSSNIAWQKYSLCSSWLYKLFISLLFFLQCSHWNDIALVTSTHSISTQAFFLYFLLTHPLNALDLELPPVIKVEDVGKAGRKEEQWEWDVYVVSLQQLCFIWTERIWKKDFNTFFLLPPGRSDSRLACMWSRCAGRQWKLPWLHKESLYSPEAFCVKPLCARWYNHGEYSRLVLTAGFCFLSFSFIWSYVESHVGQTVAMQQTGVALCL